jgi:hypothetical protein
VTEFKVGDKVRFRAEKYPDWVGQEGVVENYDGELVKYRITKSAPTDLGPRWNTVGYTSENDPKHLTLIEAAVEEPRICDNVNSPSHYTRFPVEVIELTRHLSFTRGNAVKYIARAGHKDAAKEIEDLKKAIWYIQDDITQLEKAISKSE